MAFILENARSNWWFGTEERMAWFPTPLSGADSSPEGWSDGGTLLNGGAHQAHSFGSHKTYTFEWPSASSRQVAQLLKSYSDGTYGRGLLYFISPLIYNTNVLPSMWADPSIGIDSEGASLVYGVTPTAETTSDRADHDLPVVSAKYDLDDVEDGWRGKLDAVFIPIPDGHTLALGAFYKAEGDGGVFVRTQDADGTLGTFTKLTELDNDASDVVEDTFSGTAGVWIQVGKDGVSEPSTVTISALIGRLYPTGNAAKEAESKIGPWIGGQGHSGCRFDGRPTYIEYSAVEGGQVGFAASFIEVGHWLYG